MPTPDEPGAPFQVRVGGLLYMTLSKYKYRVRLGLSQEL